MVLKKKPVNILEDNHYSKLLLYVVVGIGKYADIRKEKIDVEGKYNNITKITLCNQMKTLEKGVVIQEDDEPLVLIKPDKNRQHHLRNFILIEGSLGELFMRYIKYKYNIYEKDREFLKKPSHREYLEREGLAELYDEQMREAEKRYPLKEKKDKNLRDLVNNPSLRLKLFIEERIVNFLKQSYMVHKFNILDRTFKYHFDHLINIFLDMYNMNQAFWNSEPIMFSNNEKHKEIRKFFDILKLIQLKDDSESIVHYIALKQYLGVSESEKKLLNGHGPSCYSDYGFATINPLNQISLNKKVRGVIVR